jgi:PAS domain S-box-containing protein
MDEHQFKHQIEATHQRLQELMEQAGEPDVDPEALIESAVEELTTNLEELHVAQEELRQQNEELQVTRRQLDAERQRYQELFAFAPDGYLVTDPGGVIQEANRAASELLGVRNDHLAGKPLFLFLPVEGQAEFFTRINRLRMGEEARQTPWKTQLHPREGDPFHAALTAARIENGQGELTGLRWLVRDVSQTQRLMEENRLQRLFLERLMEAAPVGIAVVRGADHRFEMANTTYRAIPGADEPVVGRTFDQVFDTTYPENGIQVLDEVHRTGRHRSLRERQGLWVPGEGYTYWNVDLVPLRNPEGAVDGVLIVVHDVSQEVRSRKEMEILATEIQYQQDKLETIMENTHAQLAYLDADFNFIHVNTAYASGAGFKKRELVGRNHFDLFPDGENQAIFERVVQTGEPVSFRGRPFPHPGGPDGEITYWDWSLVPVEDQTGRVEGLVLSLLNVTEREQLMRQLDVEQARLRVIIESMPEALVVADAEARILFTNRVADELYGQPVPFGKEYESHRALRICYPGGWPYEPRDLPLTRAALDGERAEDVEMQLIGAEGEPRDLLVSTAPILGSDGEITGAVGVFRDITERKQIEEAVQEYAARLKMLHDLDHAILAADSPEEISREALSRLRRLVDCRRASVELFDFQAEETELLAVDTSGETRLEQGQRLPLTWNRSLEHLEEGEEHVVEDLGQVPASPAIEALCEEGIRSFVSVPLRARGELMGALNLGLATPGRPAANEIFILEDVAYELAIGIQQARLQEELRNYADELELRVAVRTAQLEASEARFRAIFEQSAVGIALLNQKGNVMISNLALEEMLGQTAEELRGQTLIDFAHPEEEIEADVAAYRQLRAGERDTHRVEVRYVGREGRTGWANLVLSLVRDGQDMPQFIVAIVEDVTERKKAQRALILSEKLATTGRLAASLGHEINNPLQTVIGCLGLAKETLEEGDAGDVEKYVTLARDEVKRAARIVGRLRDVSHPSEAGEGTPSDVNDLIEKVLEVSHKNLQNQRIEVVRDLAEDLPHPVMVPDRIKQVFLNLVLNAGDAMPEGGKLTVRSRYDEVAEEVRVAFIDGGAGIPEEMMDRLFDPFFSTKDEGTGLGLFVSRNIMQEQGGRIEVESRLGDGATFTVVLPVSRA